jgi:hypothetical protein
MTLAFDNNSGEPALNVFMNTNAIANSEEFFSRESNRHTSVAYSRIGMHSAFSRVSMVSREAVLPILLLIASKTRTN